MEGVMMKEKIGAKDALRALYCILKYSIFD